MVRRSRSSRTAEGDPMDPPTRSGQISTTEARGSHNSGRHVWPADECAPRASSRSQADRHRSRVHSFTRKLLFRGSKGGSCRAQVRKTTVPVADTPGMGTDQLSQCTRGISSGRWQDPAGYVRIGTGPRQPSQAQRHDQRWFGHYRRRQAVSRATHYSVRRTRRRASANAEQLSGMDRFPG